MKLNQLKVFQWTDKIHVPKKIGFSMGIGFAAIVLILKLRPYFSEKIVVRPFTHERSNNEKQSSDQKANKSSEAHLSATGANGHDKGRPTAAPKDRIIERPLFDGRFVTLKAVLLQNISSSQAEGTIEAQLIRAGDLTASFDSSLLDEATLTGQANPNFETKRYDLRFSELTAKTGRRYQIVAFAIDEDSHLSGVPAQYSSGLGSRLAGALIDRAVHVGENIAVGKLIDNSGSGTAASMQANQAIAETGSQGGNELSGELTKDLKNTRPELSLPVGTVFTLRVKAVSSSTGVRQ